MGELLADAHERASARAERSVGVHSRADGRARPAEPTDPARPAEPTDPARLSAPADHLRWLEQLQGQLAAAPDPAALAHLEDSALIDLIAGLERVSHALAGVRMRAEEQFRSSQIESQREAGVRREDLGRGVADQLALAKRITPKQASDQMAFAQILTTSMPATMQLLEQGDISARAAGEVAKNVIVLEREDRARIDQELADVLPAVTARRAGDLARARAQAADPAAAVKARERAVAQRRVSIAPAPNDMGRLSAILPVKDAVAIHVALTEAAKSARAGGDARSKGQVMADELVQRATGLASSDEVGVEIQLLMSDRTLLAGGPDPGWISDVPVPAPLARQVALDARGASAAPQQDATAERRPPEPLLPPESRAPSGPSGPAGPPHRQTSVAPEPRDLVALEPCDPVGSAARWIRRLYTDPVTGALVDVDARRRRFSAKLRRFILLRDQRCRTPWCDAPARDVDHAHRYADGGLTTPANGVSHCERFNHAKEMPGWSSSLDGPAGELTITTPTGHTYTSRPPALAAPSPGAPPVRTAARGTTRGTADTPRR